MTLDKYQLETTRLNICKSCPFYKDNNTCDFLVGMVVFDSIK